jgi:hypothetical protein
MTAVALLCSLRRQGAIIELDGDSLRLRAPIPLPPAVVSAVRAEKPELVRLLAVYPDFEDRLDDFEERAAIMEFESRLTRAEAERLAWIDVFGKAQG